MVSKSEMIESKLQQLERRRHLLEQKTSLHMATIAEFEEIRKESRVRLVKALKEQNEAAKKRNKEFLEEVLVDRDICKPQVTLHSSSRLQDEKTRFSKYIESSYSAVQRNKNRIMEERIAEIRMEKLAAAQRREKLRIQMLRENATKYELEKQRRELMMTIALEQREILEANAEAVLLSEEGRIVDQSILNSVQNYSEDLKTIVSEKLVHAGENSERLYKFPQRGLSINGGFLGGYNSSTFDYQAISQQPQQQQQQQYMNNAASSTGKKFSLVEEAINPLGVHSTPFPVSREMAAAMRSPRERIDTSSKFNTNAATTNFSFNVSPFHTTENLSPRASDRLDTATKPPTDRDDFKSQVSSFRISDRDSVRDPATRTSTDLAPRLESTGLSTAIDSFHQTEPAAALRETAAESSHLSSTLTDHSKSNVSEHSILPSDATAATSAVKLKSGEPSTILSKEDGKGGHSPRNVPEVVSDEIQKETEKPLVEDRDEFEEAVESSTASVVVPELSVAMAIRILKSLLPIVENNALFASVKDVYAPAAVNTNTNTLELSAAVKLIEQVMVEVDRNSGESSDGSDEKKSAAAGHSNSSIGYAVRLIVQSKAAALIPIGAFAGVVTIDKLKKEYKKTVPGGMQLQELWELLSSHMQTLMEANSAHLDYISNVFTEMYIHHVPEDDKDRLRRKVSKLLQLAMLPQSSAENSRSSSPTERFINNSVGNLSFQLPQTAFPSNPITTVQPPLSIRKAVDASSSATSSAAASAVASQSNNSNQRAKYQDSIDFEDDDDDPLFSSTTSTSKIFSQFGTTTTSRPPSSGLVIGGSSGQVGYVSSVFPSGSGETKLPAAGISQFFLGGGNASSTTDKKRATEFDDDEIMDDDEEIQKPPPLRDLDAENVNTKKIAASSTSTIRVGGAVKTTTSTIASSSWGAGRSSSNNNNNIDEFDF